MDIGEERQRKSLELKLPKPLLIEFSDSWLPWYPPRIFSTFDQYGTVEIFPFLEEMRFAFQYVLWLLIRSRVGVQVLFHSDETYPEAKWSLLDFLYVIRLWCSFRCELQRNGYLNSVLFFFSIASYLCRVPNYKFNIARISVSIITIVGLPTMCETRVPSEINTCAIFFRMFANTISYVV